MILFAMLGAGRANAVKITQVYSIPLSTTDWTKSFSVDRFDPSLGTLTAVKLTFYAEVHSDLRVENLSPSSTDSVTCTASASVTLTRPDGTTMQALIPTQVKSAVLAIYDGTLDWGGTSGVSFMDVTASQTVTYSVPPPAGDLALFQGAGKLVLPVVAHALSTVSEGTGNHASWINTQALAGLTVDYEYIPFVSISGTVVQDYNESTFADTGEPRVEGVEIVLTGTTLDGTTIAPVTTHTAADGTYLFDKLPPGNYTVTETVPTGTTPTKQPTPTTVRDVAATTPGTHYPNNDFGLLAIPVSLGDRVWYDINADGVQDAGEPGIQGVTVTVTKSDGSDVYNIYGVKVVAQTTDANGGYLFVDLPAGTYRVAVDSTTLPSGLTNPTWDYDGIATAHTAFVTLAAGEINLKVDFGYDGVCQIGDFVWYDLNADGVQDAGEPGIKDVPVTLVWAGPDGDFDQTADNVTYPVATTDSNGKYLFSNLPTGKYTVTVDKNSSALLGFVQTYSPSNPCEVTDVAPQCLTEDFGFVKLSSLAGFVYVDANNDGVKDAGEAPIAGATVTLTLPSGSTIAATTDAAGAYSFTGLYPGTYTIAETQPAGYADGKDTIGTPGGTTGNDVFSSVVLPAGTNGTDNNFGELLPASLGDYVWVDANKNGIQDAGEKGLAGVAVTLLDSGGNVVSTKETDPNGAYLFDNLAPGTYSVQFDASPVSTQYVFTAANQGSDSALDSNADINGATPSVTLAQGETNLTVDAGVYIETPAGGKYSISGTVYRDCDANGKLDSDAVGLEGFTVTLLDESDPTFSKTTTTDADGHYSFTGLLEGTYSVVVTPLADYQQTWSSPQPMASPSTGTQSVTVDADTPDVTKIDFGYTGTAPAVSITKTADKTTAKVGDTITYTIVATNTGNTCLYGGMSIKDPMLGGTLAHKTPVVPGESMTVTKTYKVTSCDKSPLVNTATAVGCPPLGGQVTATASWTVTLTAPATGSISGTIWRDCDADGTMDTGEIGLSGVTVKLLNSSKTVVGTTTTDANGVYSFTALAAGTYTVSVVGPADYKQTGASPRTTPLDGTQPVSVASGQNVTKINFGYTGTKPAVTLTKTANVTTAKVGDTITYTLVATNTGNTCLYGGLSINDPMFGGEIAHKTPVAPGESLTVTKTHTVTACDKSPIVNTATATGHPPIGSAVTATATWTVTLSTTAKGSISGRVYYDKDKDSKYECGEALSGVTVTLKDSAGNVITTTTTDCSGKYTFTGLAAGSYVVSVPTTVCSYTVSSTNPRNVTLAAGENKTGVDFRYGKSCTKPYTTYTQGGWGSSCSSAPSKLLYKYFYSVYGTHCVIGGWNVLAFTGPCEVQAFLPQGGRPTTLCWSFCNPWWDISVFAGQVMALKLNVDFSACGATKSGLGALKVQSGKLAGKTVAQVLDMANQVLGGNTWALPYGVSVSDLSGICDKINSCFDGGTTNTGYVM